MQGSVSPGMLLFLVCMVTLAGFVDAAAGGGGLISLPANLLSGMPVHMVYGTNKFSAACGTTFATANYFRRGAMDGRVALTAAAGSFAGSALGARLVLLLPDAVLRWMLLAILPAAAAVIFWRRKLPDTDRTGALSARKKLALALGIGLAIGCYDGLIGPGTGTFAILAFSAGMGYSLRTAGGNAKVLNLASNYASLAVYLASGYVVFSVAIPCALGNIAGGLLGSRLALNRGARFIRPMMLVVLVLLLVKVAADALL
jgi:uncharacterized membrane protein YfcA